MDTYCPEQAWVDGANFDAQKLFGARAEPNGVSFSVWAPNARSVRVTGDFCSWNDGAHWLSRDDLGVWRGFVPGACAGQLYKYIIEGADGSVVWKADPFALAAEVRPGTASRIHALSYNWTDGEWMASRRALGGPRNIYEVHAGSWRRHPDGSFYTWYELADTLVPYIKDMGYTHLELLPVTEHPFDGSWGYQATGFFAATSRFGEPEGLMHLIDECHRAGIGVILDWVPGHFCRDAHGLGRFDGTPLYESGDMPGWGTYKFNYARNEVRSFLISSALFWLEEYHADALRVDGVSSMLYLNFGVDDPARKKYNERGGEEDLAAIAFLQTLNSVIGQRVPGAATYAEESSAWPLVTYPPEKGGLGFHYKWDMGWMNDTLRYMSIDFDGRKYNHGLLTFSMMYAFSENYILPLSHDEVVHGKRSLIGRMPGDWWRQFAGARLLPLYAACHPGGMLSFMGNEFAQFIEWNFTQGLDWLLLDYDHHRQMREYVRMLNQFYLKHPAMWENDSDWNGFQWMSCDDRDCSVVAFRRISRSGREVIAVFNFCPVLREDYPLPLPKAGWYEPVMNSDSSTWGGYGFEPVTVHAQRGKEGGHWGQFRIPPMSAVYYLHRRTNPQRETEK